MDRINRFYRRFDSIEVGNGARIMAWIFAILNLPAFIFSVFFFYAWPVTIPGMILYVNYWRSGLDRLSFENTRSIWIGTVVYNLALFIVGGIILLNNVHSFQLEEGLILLPSLLASGMAGISLRALKAHREALPDDDTSLTIPTDGEYDTSTFSSIPTAHLHVTTEILTEAR